jgi:hypothetical protein
MLPGCSSAGASGTSGALDETAGLSVTDTPYAPQGNASSGGDASSDGSQGVSITSTAAGQDGSQSGGSSSQAQASAAGESSAEAWSQLNITKDIRTCLEHGNKPAADQKYIVLHDTEGTGSAESVVSYWASTGTGTGAHFVVNRDGSIVQCVPLSQIAHHVGFGDAGNDSKYDVPESSRDDKVGTQSIGSRYPDYGMNAYSIGIEMVHVTGGADYTQAQLTAVDGLIAYIDAYYQEQGLANGGTIIDHKMWRSTNSDTSAAFASYLANYEKYRTHDGSAEQ